MDMMEQLRVECSTERMKKEVRERCLRSSPFVSASEGGLAVNAEGARLSKLSFPH